MSADLAAPTPSPEPRAPINSTHFDPYDALAPEQLLHPRQDRGARRVRPPWPSADRVARTVSTSPVSVAVAERASAGPTATVHAKVVRAGDGGWRRMTSASDARCEVLQRHHDAAAILSNVMRLVLASASPRRAELLERPPASPSRCVRRMSTRRRGRLNPPRPTCSASRATRRWLPPSGSTGTTPAILAPTRSSWSTGGFSASPRSPPMRARMLSMLSGAVHEVLTAVVVRHAGERSQRGGLDARPLHAAQRELRSTGMSRAASRTARRAPTPSRGGLPVRRLDRGLVVERRRAARRDGLPDARGARACYAHGKSSRARDL